MLERLPGSIRITLQPAVEASVLIDNQAFGKAPGVLREVPAGAHQIEIRAPRYRAHVVQMEVEGKAIEQSLTAQLEPAWADASIDSQPSGAELSVGDMFDILTADGGIRGEFTLLLPTLTNGRRLALDRSDASRLRLVVTAPAQTLVPLPPALLLMGSALVTLRRRRRL